MALFTSAPPLWTYPPFQLRKYSQTFSRTLQLKRLGLGTIGIRWQKNSFSSNTLVCYSPLANDPAVSPDMRECAPDIVSQLTILRVPPSLWIENWAVYCKWSILIFRVPRWIVSPAPINYQIHKFFLLLCELRTHPTQIKRLTVLDSQWP